MDPVDQIRRLIDDGEPDVLTKIAVVLGFDEGYEARIRAEGASQDTVKCQTCNDHGMIGGPSYYAPDEGGEPCPDCAAAPQAGAQSAQLAPYQCRDTGPLETGGV